MTFRPLKERRKEALQRALAKDGKRRPRQEATPEHINKETEEKEASLVIQKMELDQFVAPIDDEALALQAELALLQRLEKAAQHPMRGARELAQRTEKEEDYKDRHELLGWKVPMKYKNLDDEKIGILCMNEAIVIEDIHSERQWAPIVSFKHMRFSPRVLNLLTVKHITTPSAIQQAALPPALAGRDLLGVAGTGSGKTIVYVIPLAYVCAAQEIRSRLQKGEGPFCLVLVPSRELAQQVGESIQEFLNIMALDYNLDKVVCQTVIGGVNLQPQIRALVQGCHALVGTPGRLKDLLDRKSLSLAQCELFVMDEADRLLDVGFEETVRGVVDRLCPPIQTMLFSATMPAKVKTFARTALQAPVIVHVGKAGRANTNVIQRVNLIAPHRRLKFLLNALQQTAPPVVIFCTNKSDVDDVHEYLLLKGIDAAAVHGGLSQEDREAAVKGFRNGVRDVLIGTDVASKGLDFSDVQHVVNYDMPDEIENYIHRIGRTGRRGKRGLASTFVSSVVNESVLLDLRGILLEANQEVPMFLDVLAKARGYPEGGVECAYCGGPGHRVMQCPKLESHRQKHSRETGERYIKVSAGAEGYW